jgi:hypothetical protein
MKNLRISEGLSTGGERRAGSAARNGWGGRRVGAGRPPKSGRRNTAHVKRAPHRKEHPVHVVVRSEVRSLRSQFLFPTLRGVIGDTNRVLRGRFRICHFSVQGDHLHLLVEADDGGWLRRGMHSLVARLAFRVNRLLMQSGRVIADRWYGRALETARAVRRALVYVLGNFRKHGQSAVLGGPCRESGSAPGAVSERNGFRNAVDVFSSAPYFSGYREFRGQAPVSVCASLIPAVISTRGPLPISDPQTLLLATWWKRLGLLSVLEGPSTASKASWARGAGRLRRAL